MAPARGATTISPRLLTRCNSCPLSIHSSLDGFGTGNECANDRDDSDHEEQRGMLIMCACGKAAKGQRMIHAGNQIIHSQYSSNDRYCNRAIEKGWILHGSNLSAFQNVVKRVHHVPIPALPPE